MKVSELINKLEPYKDFELEAILHLEVAEEELQKSTYISERTERNSF